LNSSDREMEIALQSLSLSRTQADESLKLVGTITNTNPNPQLLFLRGVLEKQGHENDSLRSFTNALIASSDASVWQPFGFSEAEPIEQIIRYYLKQQQPRAALKLAERDITLQRKATANPTEDETRIESAQADLPKRKYQTLAARAAERKENARTELLELLSVAAEQIGDLDRAAELETTRLA